MRLFLERNSDSMKPLRYIRNQRISDNMKLFCDHTYQQYSNENPLTFLVRYSLGTHNGRCHVFVRILFAASNLLNRSNESPVKSIEMIIPKAREVVFLFCYNLKQFNQHHVSCANCYTRYKIFVFKFGEVFVLYLKSFIRCVC